jgi:hypothetical protein
VGISVDKHTRSDVYGIYKGHPPLSYTALMPMPIEALAAIDRALNNYNWTQLLRVKTNPAAALPTDIVLAQRADSKSTMKGSSLMAKNA